MLHWISMFAAGAMVALSILFVFRPHHPLSGIQPPRQTLAGTGCVAPPETSAMPPEYSCEKPYNLARKVLFRPRHWSRTSFRRPQCGSFCFGLNSRTWWRFNACMTPIRANIVGPPCVVYGNFGCCASRSAESTLHSFTSPASLCVRRHSSRILLIWLWSRRISKAA